MRRNGIANKPRRFFLIAASIHISMFLLLIGMGPRVAFDILFRIGRPSLRPHWVHAPFHCNSAEEILTGEWATRKKSFPDFWCGVVSVRRNPDSVSFFGFDAVRRYDRKIEISDYQDCECNVEYLHSNICSHAVLHLTSLRNMYVDARMRDFLLSGDRLRHEWVHSTVLVIFFSGLAVLFFLYKFAEKIYLDICCDAANSRKQAGRCQGCGYCLDVEFDVCPECGRRS